MPWPSSMSICRSARAARSRRLTIAEIETIAIRVPLAQTYRGSAYKMTHRSTIVTRIRTEEGIVGEAYCGDEDAGLLEIDAILRTEIAPRLIGEDAFRVERCWELARPGHLRHPARPPARPRRHGLRRRRDLGRDRQGARPAAPPALGRLSRQPARDHDRRLLRDAGHRRGGLGAPRAGPRRDEVQGRRADPRGGRGAVPRTRAPPPGPTSCSAPTPTRAWTPSRGDPLRPARRGPRPVLVRGAVHLVERPARHARRPLRGRRARLRRTERVLGRRVPRPDGRGRDRLLQLRLLLVGRRDGVAPRGGGRASPSTWRWPITRSPRSPRTCSPRSRTGRSSRCSAPSATRSGGTSSPTGRRSSTGRMTLPSGPGLGWELDADYIEAYRITPRP